MAGALPDVPPYSGWQVVPIPGGWQAYDTGIVSASLAFSGLSLTPADAAAALGVGPWGWDAHFETLRAQLPALDQSQVIAEIGRVVASLHAAAHAGGRLANPLLADLMALRVLLTEGSPLREAAWQHYFPRIDAGAPLAPSVIAGARALVGGDGAQAVAHWQPAFASLGLAPFDRMLQAIYKADPEYALGSAATAAVHQLWSQDPADPGRGAVLLELLLYLGRNESAARLLAALPSPRLDGFRSTLESLTIPLAPPRCRVSILLISWNRADLLDRTLELLRRSLVWPDTEILVGLNGCTDHSAAVLARHGLAPALVSPTNEGIDLYRALFPLAQGQVLLEMDDDITALPPGLDALLAQALEAFPDYGAFSILPRVRHPDGQVQVAQGMSLGREERGGITVHQGSMWGCCLAIRREDFLAGNGFSGVRLSKRLGEEDQLMRKLYLRQRKFGYLDCGGLEILL